MKAALATAVLAAVAAGSTNAAAVEKRQSSGLTDADILNFALVLEHLESTFYSQALSNFTESDFEKAGYASNIRANIEQISMDENQHVEFLTSALSAAGATPVSKCSYKFPYSDVHGFLGLAQVVEGVGVSAYLGAAQYISNKNYLTAAASILTAEARHNAFIRYINEYSPFVTEDTPLTPTSVQSLVTPFFTGCPDGSAPPFTPFPSANLTSSNATMGSTIDISYANSSSSSGGQRYCIFLSGLEQAVAPYNNGSCTIPTSNLTTGQAYAVISSAQTFNDSTVLAGPVVLNLDRMNNTSSGSSGNSSSKGVGSNAASNVTTGAATKLGFAASGLLGVAAFAALLL